MALRGPYDRGSSDDRARLQASARPHFWSDLHHRALTIGWPGFFASAVVIFLAFNLIFASLYALGTAPIANVSPAGFLGLFYFSIETLATVGYGDMHPQTNWGHAIATVEIFTGMSLMAVMTGLVFSRFSQPRARFVFARHPVVAPHDGVSTLMVRLANARGNVIVGATAKLWLVRNERTQEGIAFRRIHELGLIRRETPSFVLSWTLLHPIDAASPLFGATTADLAAGDALFIVTISGHDETIAQQIHARFSYPHGTIRWGHRYADILSPSPTGQMTIDTTRFHETIALAPTDGEAGPTA
jgi:inward rectifier potassium channel